MVDVRKMPTTLEPWRRATKCAKLLEVTIVSIEWISYEWKIDGRAVLKHCD
jgi:hypothetical protein